MVGIQSVNLVTNISGKNQTFSVTALDPDNRLRYPFVSLGFDMCRIDWCKPPVWENLFDIEFCKRKVGGDHAIFANVDFCLFSLYFKICSGVVVFMRHCYCVIRIRRVNCTAFGLANSEIRCRGRFSDRGGRGGRGGR